MQPSYTENNTCSTSPCFIEQIAAVDWVIKVRDIRFHYSDPADLLYLPVSIYIQELEFIQ